MKHFLPPVQRLKLSSRTVSARSITVRAPKNLPWKMLRALVKGFRQDLTDADYQRAMRVTSAHSLDGLSALENDWSPQSMAQSGLNASEFFARYQLSVALKKYPFPGDQAARKKRAIAKFRDGEYECYKFNRKGADTMLLMNERDPAMAGFLEIMQHFISNVIDPTPDVDQICKDGRHGPGSSLCTQRGRVTPYYKWSDLPYTCTPNARPLTIQAIESDPRWIGALDDWYRDKHNLPKHCIISRSDLFEHVLELVPGNRITFVPKTRSIDRSIAIEPRMNLFLQLGVDAHIRRRLKRFGCDLDSQVKNQVLAAIGSETGKFATLDLSMASDTIALRLVELLFPPGWVDLLYDLRSPVGCVDSGDEQPYHKLSSMGNGYTFAVESLIFLAIAFASKVLYERKAGEKRFNLCDDVAIFGDDIIVPTPVVPNIQLLLDWCGFTLNYEKSFTDGPFRESCGKDYYHGTPVRPLYFRKEVVDVQEAFSIFNRAQYWDSQGCTENLFPEGRYEGLTTLIYRLIPERFRLITGPLSDTEFDTYLHTPVTKAKPSNRYGLYAHFRLIKTAKTGFRANRFFFRKLMALTRPVNNRYSRMPLPFSLDGSGNVFDVTQRNAVCYKLVETRTSYWFDYYYPDV